MVTLSMAGGSRKRLLAVGLHGARALGGGRRCAVCCTFCVGGGGVLLSRSGGCGGRGNCGLGRPRALGRAGAGGWGGGAERTWAVGEWR